jgi:hypothetical protein
MACRPGWTDEFCALMPSYLVTGRSPDITKRCVGRMSKYFVLLYAQESAMPKPGTPEFDTQNAAYGAVFENFSKRGAFVNGDPLSGSGSATSVRVRNGQRQDAAGPATSSAEQIIGYYVLEAKDQAAANELAATIPCAQTGTVEVRPVFEM